MRKLTAVIVLLLALIGGFAAWRAEAGTVPQISGANAANCEESSQNVNCMNSQIIAPMNNSFGFWGGLVGPVNSTGTTNEQTLATTPIPPGVLTATGNSLRLRCGGTTSSNTNSKTAKLYFGAASIVTPAMTTSGINWELELLVTLAATPNTVILGRGSIGGGLGSFAAIVTPIATNDTFDNLSSAVTAKCTTVQGTASASDTVLEDFIIELVK